MGVVLTNNVSSVLANGVAAGDTMLTIDPNHADRFPSITPGEYAYATLSMPPESLTLQVEIVRITDRTGNQLTVVRGVDGTVPQAFPKMSVVALRINAASVLESFISNYDVLLL